MTNVTVINGTMDQKEIAQYINLIEKENKTLNYLNQDKHYVGKEDVLYEEK